MVVVVIAYGAWRARSSVANATNKSPLAIAGSNVAFCAGEPPRTTAARLGPYLRHVHFKDSVLEGGKTVPRLIGRGDLPLEQVIAALRSIDYNGWICLETEKRWHPDTAPEPEESLPQFVRWMERHWATVH